jgi:SPP1 gp7 family putative phage head morphogenesis protein
VTPAELTRARVRAVHVIGLHLPRRGLAGQFHRGHSGNPTGRGKGAVPRVPPPTAIEREYQAALLALVRRLRPAFADLERELPALLASAHRETRGDADETQRIRTLVAQARAAMAASLSQSEVDALARKFAARVSTYQRIAMNRQTKAVLGIDVIATDRRLPALVQAFVDANVGLVKNIPDKLAHDVEAASLRAVQTGKLHGDLADELENKFGFAEDRAKLIARDQVGKLYGQVNAARQRELGVRRFQWVTVHDERVRPEHEDRDGKIYSYDDPPDGELPGEPINCRCYASPMLDDLLDDEDE